MNLPQEQMDLEMIYTKIQDNFSDIKCFTSNIIADIMNKEIEINSLNSNPEGQKF